MVGTRQFFIGGMKWQHAAFLESIWETDSVINHFPVLANKIPYSSSDLPYFTLLLYLNKIILSRNFSSLSPFGLQISKSNFNPPKIILRQFQIVLVKFQFHLIENILRQFQTVS